MAITATLFVVRSIAFVCRTRTGGGPSLKSFLFFLSVLLRIKGKGPDNKENERNYFLNNSELVFGYFENKIEVSEGINKTTVLDRFFNKKSGANDNNFEKEDNNINCLVVRFNRTIPIILRFIIVQCKSPVWGDTLNYRDHQYI